MGKSERYTYDGNDNLLSVDTATLSGHAPVYLVLREQATGEIALMVTSQ